ncbi:LADA_0E06898g1_1 [Lachancea dasiensis]|uniref:Protein transport protein SEC23 n=1 Tax=Lachancea dasiensis TaxID=1072105 RepID=A0A1G4JCL8_9SACH|nr:LADA_0E06898g1_1 [Lachancea dasiensis]
MLLSTFDVVPTSRLEAELQMPYLHEPGHFDVLYESNNDVEELRTRQVLQACSSCGAALMDKCAIIQEQWVCVFCQTYNPLTEKATATPYEVEVPSTESSGSPVSPAPYEVLIIDLYTDTPQELASLKDAIVSKIRNCDPTFLFGLITIHPNSSVSAHTATGALSFAGQDAAILDSAKKFDLSYFKKVLPALPDLLLPKEQLVSKLMGLAYPQHHCVKAQRAQRALGLALLLGSAYSRTPDNLPQSSAFVSGPCTVGPGKVIPKKINFHMRQHHDIDAHKDKYFRPARTFFQKVASAIQVQLFISNLDQVGVVEMAPACQQINQFDSFCDKRFKDLALRFWPQGSINNEITVFASKGLLIDGCYGMVSKLPPSRKAYSDTPAGVAGTNRWRSSTSMPSLAFSFCIDTWATKAGSVDVVPAYLAIQIQQAFSRGSKRYLKVDSVILSTTNKNNIEVRSVEKSFNYSAALTCFMKRIAYDQLLLGHTHALDLQQWQITIDKLGARHFKASSRNHAKYIELLYRLKCTALLQKRNTSPDEAAIFQNIILTQSSNVLELLCKPRVVVFANDTKVEVASLDEQLLQQREVMCVDCGIVILLRYLQEDNTLESARNYANTLLTARTLPAKLEETVIKGSQDRYLISRLIPEGNLNTEDTSLCEYRGVIRKLAQCIQ